ncbi:hypothetical protein BVY03_00070 [bacterium K02(2017)]|nr:hypothetical protein BVY03_00070 [bacterium K02(2017)]
MILKNTYQKFKDLMTLTVKIGLSSVLIFNVINCSGASTDLADDIIDGIGGGVSVDGGSNTNLGGSILPGTSGMLKAADGSPIAGASIALTSKNGGASYLKKQLKNKNGKFIPLFNMKDKNGNECEDITGGIDGNILARTCSDDKGTYSFTAENLPCNETISLHAKKGSFYISADVTLKCYDDSYYYPKEDVVEIGDITFEPNCVVDRSVLNPKSTDSENKDDQEEVAVKDRVEADGCKFDIAKMAVVTGAYDEIENVLAKLGFASINEYGALDKNQPMHFTLVDGNHSLDDANYDNLIDFLSDYEKLKKFDIVFINCGSSYESIQSNPEVIANLQQYVETGGKLYVTDWSYGFLENTYPSFMNFANGGHDPLTAESHGAAKVGSGGISVEANVNDSVLQKWLGNVTVNDGSVGEDCYYLGADKTNAKLGALNANGTISIADFLGAWAQMEGEHIGYEGQSKVWITAENVNVYNGYYDYSDDVYEQTVQERMPLTVTQEKGEGRILYSSYHTAHSCLTKGFWPQERVLQYLVFEL